MRSYFIDEISPEDMKKIRRYLQKNVEPSTVPAVFWVEIPDHLLTDIQSRHAGCRPHVFAVELGPQWIKLEFFVRSLNRMRCACTGFCDERQRHHVITFADAVVERLGIGT